MSNVNTSRFSQKQPTEHCRGPTHPKVKIVEYLDFQCPYSAEAEGPINQVLDVFGNDVALVVRHFPLIKTHAWAEEAALASEAAALQGKFWEMHDLLFANQDELSNEGIFALAESLGLDMQQFTRDFQSTECLARVNQDKLKGLRQGVHETPTIFVGGHKIDQVSFASLSRAVAGSLSAAAA